MAVDVMSPDARKKVDELFLYWLSEQSTQELLRSELARVCGLQSEYLNVSEASLPVSASSTHAKGPIVHGSSLTAAAAANATSSPPPLNNRSPKSPRSTCQHAKPSAKHERTSEEGTAKGKYRSRASAEGEEQVDAGVVERERHLPSAACRTVAEPSCGPAVQLPSPAPRESIPPFYFPNGRPHEEEDLQEIMTQMESLFAQFPNHEIPKKEFHLVTKVLNLPFYWRMLLFRGCQGSRSKKAVSFSAVKKTWLRVTQQCHDDASRFVRLLTLHSGRNYLVAEDFEPLVQDVVDSHPGLEFLQSSPEFHARYIETVIGRIFYTVDRSWRGRITVQDLRVSNFLPTLHRLEGEDDINKITEFFSYEHFYVIYCKFWELDTDHDLLIDDRDLARHADHALPARIIERLTSGVVRCDKSTPPGKMSYKDFVWFLIAEEDKTSRRSVEYWFRVMDLDGDGSLSLFELEYFYADVLHRLGEMNIECLSVENTVCQVLDMINPREPDKIFLSDLKSSKMTPVFFNTFVNIEKYLEYEQREPLPAAREDDVDGSRQTDWERFASEQYEILVAEELNAGEEYEDDEEELMESDLQPNESGTSASLQAF